MAEKYSVLVKYKYLEYIESAKLSDADAWKLMRGIIEYDKTEETPAFENPVLTGIFAVIKLDLDQNKEAWNEVSQTRSESGKKGGAPKGNQNAKKNKQNNQKQAKQPNGCFLAKNNQKQHDNDSEFVFVRENGGGKKDLSSHGGKNSGSEEKPPPFFIKTIQEEAERLGLILDSKLVSKIDLSGIDPAWLGGPFNFLQFAYEQLTANPNYKGKRTKDYELLLAASFSWEDFRKKYPAWKQAREKAEAEREKKQAQEEARKKALAKRPRTCPKCKTKLDDNLTCQTCGGYYLFEEEKLEYVLSSKPEKTLVKKFEERLKHGGDK